MPFAGVIAQKLSGIHGLIFNERMDHVSMLTGHVSIGRAIAIELSTGKPEVIDGFHIIQIIELDYPITIR
jgi:hypothetical protein